MAGLMQMPNGQMIVRAVAPPAAPRVSSRNHAVTPRVRTRAGARAARSFLFPSPRSVPSEADAPSPSPAATPNRAPARGHGHQPRQRPADFQHQRVHGGGGLRPHHPGTSPRRLAVRRSARRLRPRPFDFVFPLTTPVRSRRAREAWTSSCTTTRASPPSPTPERRS